MAPSPIVELNRAVAVAMAHGPRQALPIVDELAASGRLSGSYLLPSVRGELLARLGRIAQARTELEMAARLCRKPGTLDPATQGRRVGLNPARSAESAERNDLHQRPVQQDRARTSA